MHPDGPKDQGPGATDRELAQSPGHRHRQGWTKLGNRNVRYWPAYQFLDPRGTLYAGESEVSYVDPPVPGSFLEVAYNPADPNQSFQVDAPSKVVLGCLIPVFAFFALAAFWFIGVFPLS